MIQFSKFVQMHLKNSTMDHFLFGYPLHPAIWLKFINSIQPVITYTCEYSKVPIKNPTATQYVAVSKKKCTCTELTLCSLFTALPRLLLSETATSRRKLCRVNLSYYYQINPIVTKEVQIVYRLFLVNSYLLHVLLKYAQPASNVGGVVIH